MGRWRGKNVEKACAAAERAQKARKKRNLIGWLEAVTRPPGRWAGDALTIRDVIYVGYGQRPSVQKLRQQMSENVNKFLAQYDQDTAPDEITSFLDYTDRHRTRAWSGGSNLPARRP